MKRTYLLGTMPIENEESKVIQLDYYLLEEQRKENKDSLLYGIRIVKTIDTYIESEEVEAISYSKEFVKQIISKLIENSVTPICLIEIVDEFITLELCS